ncbi:MAG TPA: ABC transporter permease [Gemmatimonadales bacterium]|jgi:ribose/xylose/arabinose/galactoside ABC-type transport system permease subunit
MIRGRSWARVGDYALAGVTAVEALIFAAVAPGFFSVANLVNIALSIAVTGILAVGMTAVMVTGGIDLGVGSVVALSGVAAALAAVHGAPILTALVAALGVGVLTGVVNGTLIAYLKVPAFVATLAMLTAARGLAFLVAGGRSHGDLPDAFGFIGRTSVLAVPTPVFVMIGVMLVGAFVLQRTVYGRHLYAVGGNAEAARLAGIDVRRVTWWVYVINGVLVGLAGLTLASRLGAGVPNAGVQYELDVIAACVVGGTSLIGGRGTVGGTLWGTVFIGVLTNGLNLANVDPYVQKIALGVVIVVAVIGDQLGRREQGG